MNDFSIQLITGALIGLGSGYLGSFMVLRRMSLVGDALSHVALPGIAIALLLHINPFVGAFTALLAAIVGIWALERKTELPSETLVGIFFTLSLAIGLLLTPEAELLEALFGDISKIGMSDMFITLVLITFAIYVMSRIRNELTLGIISKDLTKSMGININSINLIFFLMIAIVVALGLKVAGTLLMGSLVIIPAAAAKNLSRNLNGYSVMSGIIGALSALLGIIAARYLGLAPGPIVVLASGVIFLGTLALKK
jgi:zinc transport system permease protein